MNTTLSYNYQFTMDTYFDQFFEGVLRPLYQDLDLFWRTVYFNYSTIFWIVFPFFIYSVFSKFVNCVCYLFTFLCKKRNTEQEIFTREMVEEMLEERYEEIAEQLIEISDKIYQLRKKITKKFHENDIDKDELKADVQVLGRIYHNKRRKINYAPIQEEEEEDSSDYEEEEDEEEAEGIRLRSGRIIIKRKNV